MDAPTSGSSGGWYSGQPLNAHEHHPPLEWLPGPAIEVIGTHVETPAPADMQLPQLPTVEAHNAAATTTVAASTVLTAAQPALEVQGTLVAGLPTVEAHN